MVSSDGQDHKMVTLDALLPHSFGPEKLQEKRISNGEEEEDGEKGRKRGRPE
jgi:hypothetical protein